jgi:hypothetical protein
MSVPRANLERQSRQPQVGGSRNDALFAGRQCQVRVVLRDHMIANQQDPT